MSLNNIYLKNFRIIGKEGAVVSFSPVTIFTGCNSAGKSTVAKAMVLIDSYLSALKANDFNMMTTSLDFSKTGKLGTFDGVLNVKSKEEGIETIVLGYGWQSSIFVENMQAYFTFIKKDGDQLGNGWLKRLSIAVGSLEIFSIEIHDDKYNIGIPDIERFLKYYQWYMVKQIASGWREYQKEVDEKRRWAERTEVELRECQNEKCLGLKEITAEEQKSWDEFYEKIAAKLRESPEEESKIKNTEEYYSIAMDELLCYEKDLVEAGRIRKELWILDFNKDIVNGISAGDILSLVSDSFCQDIPNISGIQDMKDFLDRNILHQKNVFECIDSMFRTSLFIKAMVEEALKPEFLGKIGYVDSSTVEVQRNYLLDGTNRFGNLWKEYNNLIVGKNTWTDYKPGTFMNKCLRELGICDSVKIENEDGQLRIKLVTNESPDGRMLADYGYGVTQLVSLLLNIELAINKVGCFYSRHMGEPEEVDYYITKPLWLIIEEPEVHLHPLLQSKLADMFRDASKYGVKLIVETHSEYLVRRSQVLVAEGKYDRQTLENKNPFRVYYFPKDGLPYDMKYQPNGYFEEPFGEGFFDEAGKWSRQLNYLKKQ